MSDSARVVARMNGIRVIADLAVAVLLVLASLVIWHGAFADTAATLLKYLAPLAALFLFLRSLGWSSQLDARSHKETP